MIEVLSTETSSYTSDFLLKLILMNMKRLNGHLRVWATNAVHLQHTLRIIIEDHYFNKPVL